MEIIPTENEMKDRIVKLKKDLVSVKNKEYKEVLTKQIRYWKKRLDWLYTSRSDEFLRGSEYGEEDKSFWRRWEGYIPYDAGITKVGDSIINRNRR